MSVSPGSAIAGCCFSVEGVGFVDRALRLVWSRCPCTIAAERGGYFLTSSLVISGHDAKKPASSALQSVDRAGFPSAPWRKAILSAIVAYGVVFSLAARTNAGVFCAEMKAAAKAWRCGCIGADC